MKTSIDRRRLLIGISAAMGGILTARAASALDAALAFSPTGEFHTLKPDQVTLLRAIMDTILPETDTPAASAVGVADYIDHMMTKVLSADENKVITDFLKAFDTMAPGFAVAAPARQYEILNTVDGAMYEEDTFHGNYRTVKELIFVGYFSSESGGTINLAYDPIPGPFHTGPITEFSKTWST